MPADRVQDLFTAALARHRGGQLAEAERLYRSTLAIDPKHEQSHYLIGIVALQLGRPQDAIESISRALALNERMPEWHYNLGFAYQSVGRLDDAVAHYRRAVDLKPDFIDAQSNLARALLTSGQAGPALAASMQALKLDARPEIKRLVVEALTSLRSVPVTVDLRNLVLRAATESWGNLADFAHVVAAQLDPAVVAMVRRAADAWPQRLPADVLLGPDGNRALAQDHLLHCLLTTTTICNHALEQFLTCLRRVVMDWADHCEEDKAAIGPTIEIGCVLARQCFINEYIYVVQDDEAQRVTHLKSRLAALLARGESPPALWLAAVAAYEPLHGIPGAEALLAHPWPDAVRHLVRQQVDEPREEASASIRQLTPIDDHVSAEVRRQYEESPYPRWVRAAPPAGPVAIDAYLRSQLPLAPLRELRKERELDILVAGCGTGQHPILTSQLFMGARVLAVDLSRASLAYAQRKTRELGLAQIDYAQADILALGDLGRSFDVIEAVGVLHHLADPQAGWRVLLSLLRLGGVMNIGLYSELARQDVVAARGFIAARGNEPTATDIRRCRQELLALEDASPLQRVTGRVDFFSMSGCRDLMFHVQEHRLTLPAIKSFLAEQGVRFLGFQLGHDAKRAYAVRFPDDRAMIDLDCWHVFETEKPETFAAMYRFWVQKRG